MIKILVRTNFAERETIVSKETELNTLINQFNINPHVAPPALQGVVISREDYDETLDTIMDLYGFQGDSLMLTTVVKSNNA